jgi:hypothetical protein
MGSIAVGLRLIVLAFGVISFNASRAFSFLPRLDLLLLLMEKLEQ